MQQWVVRSEVDSEPHWRAGMGDRGAWSVIDVSGSANTVREQANAKAMNTVREQASAKAINASE